MTNTKPVRRRHQGRIFPEFKITPEELAKREDEKKTRLEIIMCWNKINMSQKSYFQRK